MLILAGDTTSNTSSVALWQDGKVLADINIDLGLTHSETFFPILKSLLDLCNIEITAVDAFASVIGPGSFTGIRIGVAGMKMLAYANNKPVYPVNSLDAIAEHYRKFYNEAIIVPCIDARNERIFTAAYKNQTVILEPEAEDIEIWLNKLAKTIKNQEIVFLGLPNYERYDELIKKLNLRVIAVHSEVKIYASDVAELTARKIAEGEEGKPEDLNPLYLVPSQAERMRKND